MSFDSLPNASLVPIPFQKLYCTMLDEMTACGGDYASCNSPAEVRSMKDDRIEQFMGYTVAGVDPMKCNIVQEYVNSGRAQEKSRSGDRQCTAEEVRKYLYSIA